MEITIKGKAYKLKYTLRALFIYEQITGKLFKLETLTDLYVFFYCILAANNQDLELTFDDLIDALDNDGNLMKEYLDFMLKEMDKLNQFPSKDVDDKKKF